MKRSYLLVLAAILLSVTSLFAESTAKKAYYLDFKDGNVQVLWTDWVDSMRVSKIDLDSVLQPKYVTQEIWMSDTVLRYPLDSIEQISFVTPAPEFKPGVIRFEDGLENYIIGCDSLTVYLRPDTPDDLIPEPGKLVCYLKMTDIFPAAFAGEVVKVTKGLERIAMQCTLTSLLDIFDTYYSSYIPDDNEEEVSRATPPSPPHNNLDFSQHTIQWTVDEPYQFNLTPLLKYASSEPITESIADWQQICKFDVDAELSRELSQAESSSGPQVRVNFTPNMEIRITRVIRRRFGPIPNGSTLTISAHGEFTNELIGAYFGKFSLGDQSKLTVVKTPLTPNPFVTPYIEAGGFVNLDFEADLAFKIASTHKTDWIYSFSVLDRSALKNARAIPVSSPSSTTTIGTHFKGSISAGIFFSLGLKFLDEDIAEVRADAELGVKAEGSVSIPLLGDSPAENNWIYNELQDNYFRLYPYWGISLDAYLGKRPVFGDLFSMERMIGKPWFERTLVPEFSDIDAGREKENLSTVMAKTNIQNSCILPWKVGFGAFDANNTLVKTRYYDRPYRNNKDFSSYIAEIDSLTTAKDYKIYPVIDIAGHDIPCSLSADVDKVMTVKTGKSKNISFTQATLTGKAENVGKYDVENGKFMIECAPTDGQSSIIFQPVNISQKYDVIEFEVKATDLKPGAEYAYKALCEVDETTVEGERRDFRTDESSSEIVTLPVTFVCAGTAELGASTDLPVSYDDDGQLGFMLCPGSYTDIENIIAHPQMLKFNSPGIKDENNLYHDYARDLSPSTDYSYIAYCSFEDGKISYGNVEHFTTKSNDIDIEQENRQALIDFYNQTEASETSLNSRYSNWCQDTPLCHWIGISHLNDGSLAINLWEPLKNEPVLKLNNCSNLYLNRTDIVGITLSGTDYHNIDLRNNESLSYVNFNDFKTVRNPSTNANLISLEGTNLTHINFDGFVSGDFCSLDVWSPKLEDITFNQSNIIGNFLIGFVDKRLPNPVQKIEISNSILSTGISTALEISQLLISNCTIQAAIDAFGYPARIETLIIDNSKIDHASIGGNIGTVYIQNCDLEDVFNFNISGYPIDSPIKTIFINIRYENGVINYFEGTIDELIKYIEAT